MKEREKDAPQCGGCRHFIQHYGLDADGMFRWLNCGHCVQKRMRKCENFSKACESYAPWKEAGTEGAMKQVSADIEEALFARLRAIAARERRTVSGQIQVLIRDFVKAYEDPAAKTAGPHN